MAYIFKQKLNLHELVPIEIVIPRVLIFEPEDYLAGLYAHYLRSHNFDIKHCQNLEQIKEHLNYFAPKILIFNVDDPGRLRHVKSLLKSFPEIKIVTTAYNIGHEDIRELMAIGALSHLNRRFSRPADLPALLKTLLNH